jgi:hypothetical protein
MLNIPGNVSTLLVTPEKSKRRFTWNLQVLCCWPSYTWLKRL